MNILVFDTETTSLDKPFCYNVGYVIIDTNEWAIVEAKDFVVEQCWHNLALFSSAYYADKRPLYVSRMKSRKIKMDKWGYIMQQMIRDIKTHDVQCAYAYNCKFDEKVFDFNCDWYKTQNPLDLVEVYDIRGYVVETIAYTKEFQDYCDTYELYTENGNYSTTAETLFKFVANSPDFIEEHTALADSEIEGLILRECLVKGATLETHYKVPRSIERVVEKELTVVDKVNKTETTYNYCKRLDRGNKIFLS